MEVRVVDYLMGYIIKFNTRPGKIIMASLVILQMVALYKDPKGKTVTIFTRPISVSQHSPQPHAKSDISIAVQKSLNLTDHSAASEVELLRRRICELESRLANGNHEKNNLE